MHIEVLRHRKERLELESQAGKLAKEIFELAPQYPPTIPRTNIHYYSATLLPPLISEVRAHQSQIADALAELGDRVHVLLSQKPRDKKHYLELGGENKHVVIDFDRLFRFESAKMGDIHNSHTVTSNFKNPNDGQLFWVVVLNAIREDLHSGREKWTDAVRTAKAKFFQRIGSEASADIGTTLQMITMIFPPNTSNSFSVFAELPNKENPNEFKLVTTRPIFESDAWRLDEFFPYHRFKKGSYLSGNPRDGGEYSIPTQNGNLIKLRKGYFGLQPEPEESFASFMGGRDLNFGFRDNTASNQREPLPIVLLWRSPNSTPSGPLFTSAS